MLESIKINADYSGQTVLILGRIHGDEPIGTKIINRLIRNINAGDVHLVKGALHLIPCCNQKAAKENVRFLDMNLNRIISKDLANKHIGTHESNLALQVMNHINDADIVIDLHSFPDPDTPAYMICVDDSQTARDMVKASQYKTVLCASPFLTPADSQMTVDYAQSQNKPAVLIEAGYHDDPDALDRGYEAVLNILSVLGLVDEVENDAEIAQDFVVMKDYILQKDECELIFPLETATYIKVGDPIYKSKNGDIIKSDKEGHIFAKNYTPKKGEEYCYIADISPNWPNRGTITGSKI